MSRLYLQVYAQTDGDAALLERVKDFLGTLLPPTGVTSLEMEFEPAVVSKQAYDRNQAVRSKAMWVVK